MYTYLSVNISLQEYNYTNPVQIYILILQPIYIWNSTGRHDSKLTYIIGSENVA